MFNFKKFPYTNVHELNLDWVIEELRRIEGVIEGFIERIPGAFVTRVNNELPDANGNVSLHGFVKSIWGQTPNEAGELDLKNVVKKIWNNGPDANGNISPHTIPNDIHVSGGVSCDGTLHGTYLSTSGGLSTEGGADVDGAITCGQSISAASEVRAGHAAIVGAVHLVTPENRIPEGQTFPEVQIFQQEADSLKIGIVAEGSQEVFCKIKVGDPTDNSHAMTYGAYLRDTKPFMYAHNSQYNGVLMDWSTVTESYGNFTYQDIIDRVNRYKNTGGAAPTMLVVTGSAEYYPCPLVYFSNTNTFTFKNAGTGTPVTVEVGSTGLKVKRS